MTALAAVEEVTRATPTSDQIRRILRNEVQVEESEKNYERMKSVMSLDFEPKVRDEDRIKVVVDRELPER
ncbi:hypothetical protein ANCDUO_01553 [Ancylostoma duodenale]|uniref:Uncharacterized protein n=1 Tax=Ancylostoma duodenale TaxID=51022 RepID=A0A0C2H2V4_9BILA|nr:hypothetical protein ANCDUO_01553 [Ancylostoma duodenale]